MTRPIHKASISKSTLIWGATGIVLTLIPAAALAHERFIAHTPKMKIYEPMFDYLSGNMLNIATRVAVIMAIMMFTWFIREPLDELVNGLAAKLLPRWLQGIVRFGTDFAFDKPIENTVFNTLHKWVVIFFLRCPALVLMFAAANKSLVMPSYPLEPSTVKFFQFAQVVMAIGILTQSFLPFGGATIFGTFIYLLTYFDWKIAVDVLPVLTVGVIYVSSPWDSWKRVITSVNYRQMKWVQIILGMGFFLLGWMKLYNYYLTVGVADNYPEVLSDPMVLLFYAGTDKSLVRECWIIAFGMAEVMTGFLVMLGIYSRVWCLMMVYIFTKLMLVNFGWDEIPHLYPIGAFLLVMTSSNLWHAFGFVDRQAVAVTKTGKHVPKHVVQSILLALCISLPVIFLPLWGLTHTHPKPTPTITPTAVFTPDAQGGGKFVVTIPSVPMVATQSPTMHFRFRAKIARFKRLDTVEWIDKDYPPVVSQETDLVPNRTAEEPIVTSSQSRQITLIVPAAGEGAASPVALDVTLTRLDDQKMQAPRTFDIALPKP